MSKLASSTNTDIDLSTLGLKLRLIHLEYPEVEAFEELAVLISEVFKVNCTVDDIRKYMDLHTHSENLERESNLIKYGNCY